MKKCYHYLSIRNAKNNVSTLRLTTGQLWIEYWSRIVQMRNKRCILEYINTKRAF